MKLFIICSLLAIVYGFKIEQVQNVQSSGNLQMANYTGSSITSAMVAFYIKTINEAYIYFNTDYSNNTAYIVNRLESTYTGSFFEVIIMTENVTVSTLLYSTNGTSTVCWSNVNTAKPTWGYIITMRGTISPQQYINTYSTSGSGINQTLRVVINNVLRDAESTGTCSCKNIDQINQHIQNYDGNKWSVVCKNSTYSYTMYSRIRVTGNRYISTSPNYCQYLLWAI